MIYGNKFLNCKVNNELIIEAELSNIDKIIESFDIINESAEEVFKKIIEKAKEVLAKIIDLISKVFKKIIPKLYDAMQKLVKKLRGSDSPLKDTKITEKKIISYSTWTDTYHKYFKNIAEYCELVDKHYSIICNIYTYENVSKELEQAQESKKKIDALNEEIIKLASVTASSSIEDFENKMIAKTELEIDAGAHAIEILKNVAKIDQLLFDVKQTIANVNEFANWAKKVKDDVDGLVKAESSKAFDNAMRNNKSLVIGDVSYGDNKLLQATGLQEVTRTLLRHFSNLSHVLNLYLKNNLQAYKSVCGLLKDPEQHKEYINQVYLMQSEINGEEE